MYGMLSAENCSKGQDLVDQLESNLKINFQIFKNNTLGGAAKSAATHTTESSLQFA